MGVNRLILFFLRVSFLLCSAACVAPGLDYPWEKKGGPGNEAAKPVSSNGAVAAGRWEAGDLWNKPATGVVVSVPADPAEAARWYREAATRGDARAQYQLGQLLRNGTGVAKDPVEACMWLRKSAAQGNADAQNMMGYCTERGEGVPASIESAFRWYLSAARQGHAVAQRNVGLCYAYGRGIAADTAVAYSWYEKSASNGNVSAMCNVVGCLLDGIGVAKDQNAALQWFRKASGRLGEINKVAPDAALAARLEALKGRFGKAIMAEELVNQAAALESAGKFAESLAKCQEAVELADSPSVREKIEQLKKVLAKGDEAKRYFHEGYKFEQAGKYREAIIQYELSLGLVFDEKIKARVVDLTARLDAESRAQVLVLQGYELERAGNIRGAIEKYKAVLELVSNADVEKRIAQLEGRLAGVETGGQVKPPAGQGSKPAVKQVPQSGSNPAAVPEPPRPTAAQQRVEQIEARANESGLLDAALVADGGFPYVLGQAPVVTNFPGFPSEDPCNPVFWTLPIVAWSTSHYASVFNKAVAKPEAVKKREPAPPLTPAAIEAYQRTVYSCMESMRLLCGATTGDIVQVFNKLWSPFVDHPTAEAFDYFSRLDEPLSRYWDLYGKIEGDLDAGRQAWQQAGVAAGMLNEVQTRAALDNGFMIMSRLKGELEEAGKIMGEIAALGDPPNPLEAKCNARKRHQAALNAVAPLEPDKPGAWVLVDVIFTNVFGTLLVLNVDDTSVTYVKPLERYDYDYHMRWSHPPARLEPGAVVEMMFRSVRTGLDSYDSNYYIDVPRMFVPAIQGATALLTQIRYPREDYFTFVMNGSVSTWKDGEKSCLEIRLLPHAGLNRTRLEPYERGRADWRGERIYRYEWDATGKRRAYDPGASAADAETGLPPPPAEPLPPPHTPAETLAAIAEHQQQMEPIRKNLQRATAELEKEKDPERRQRLVDEILMHQANLQEEEDRIESLKTGRVVHTRTAWEQREEQRFLDKIQKEVALLSAETKWVAGLPKMANNRENGRYEVQQEVFREMQSIYNSGLTLEERVERLRKMGAKVQSGVEGEQKVANEKLTTAENRLWYAEKVQTAANLGIMAGALVIPGAGYVAMGYGFGSGWAEGGPAKAGENTIRALSTAVDVAWAGYDGYYAKERDPATGKLRYRGWSGALQDAACTFLLNKVFEKVGERMQGHVAADVPGMAQTGAAKGSKGAGKGDVGPEPKIDAFVENSTRYKDQQARTDQLYEGWYPKDADGKIDTSHPNYEKVKAMHEKARASVREEYGVIAKREELKGELTAITRKHESRIPEAARNADGTVNTEHPAYKEVKAEWEADMKAARDKHNEGFEQRWNEQQQIIQENGLDALVTPSGGKPKSVMSDIDLTAKDMASGLTFVQGMRDRGHKVLDFCDRWVIPGTDTTIWKPNARPEKIGSGAHSSSVDYFTSRGSDKFPTEGGVAYTTKNAAGVEDPAGAVIANVKKATEAGVGGNSAEVDYHVIGKSCDKAAEIANTYDPSKPIQDPAFFEKAKSVREHKTPEEAGIMTFGNSESAKNKESRQFLNTAQEHMQTAMKVGEAASLEKNAGSMQMIRDAEAAGDKKTANAIREMLVRARVSNEAAMQSLSRQDPGFISKLHAAITSVPPPPALQPPPGRKFGYGWLLKNTQELNAGNGVAAAPGNVPPVADRMKAASKGIEKEALPVLKDAAPAKGYFQALKGAFDEGEANPLNAARSVRAASGYEMSKVAADIASLGARKNVGSIGGGRLVRDPLGQDNSFAGAPPLENRDLADVSAVWVYQRMPIAFTEIGPLGVSDCQRKTNQIAPRVEIVPVTEVAWNASALRAAIKKDKPNDKSESVANLIVNPKGDKLDLVQTDVNSTSAHQESWALFRAHDIPLVEDRVFGSNKSFRAWVYRLEAGALQRVVEMYDFGMNSSWDIGRWKWIFDSIRWGEQKDVASFTVVLCTFHPSRFDELERRKAITAIERAEFEGWIRKQRKWEDIKLPPR